MDILHELYETVEGRRQEKQEGSYTCYLFEKGLDKILKKVRRGVQRGHHRRQKRQAGGHRGRARRPAVPPDRAHGQRGHPL